MASDSTMSSSRPGGGYVQSDVASLMSALQTSAANGEPINYEMLKLLNEVDLQAAGVSTFGEAAQAELRDQLAKCLNSEAALQSTRPGGTGVIATNSEEFAKLMQSITKANQSMVGTPGGPNMFLPSSSAPPSGGYPMYSESAPTPAGVGASSGFYQTAPMESTMRPQTTGSTGIGAAGMAAAAAPARARVVEVEECIKHGWVEKLGGKKKNKWQRRWVELDFGSDIDGARELFVFSYKGSPMDKKCKGFIMLTGCTLSTDVEEAAAAGKTCTLMLSPREGPKLKDYVLAFFDSRERESWRKAIDSAMLYNAQHSR
eukprot:c5155_g1_i1.p1 GENE.c5155_g1_i1~~c5155_g1_i1.p1  ORF type:complete len:316 (+),score=50.44 c5155_g1_i1:99-1046(+)